MLDTRIAEDLETKMPEEKGTEATSQLAKEKKRRALTLKQKKLVKALPNSESIAEAGRKAGYSGRDSAHTAMKTVREKMPGLMDRLGLTDEALVNNYLRPGLDAMKTEFFADKGVVIETRDVISWGDRRGFLDMAFKVKGSYPRNTDAGDGGNGALPEGFALRLEFIDGGRAQSVTASVATRRGSGQQPVVDAEVHSNAG